MEPVTLHTERLMLSMPRAEDVDAVFAACQDAELQRFTTVPVPYAHDDAASFVNGFVPQSWLDGTECVFGIRPDQDSPLLGVVSWQRERQAIGYWLGAESRGRGIMTEAVRGVIDWIFAHDEVDVLHWECHSGNVGSAIVAQRAGFRWVGEGLCSVVARDGVHPWGWLGEMRRTELGTVQARAEWPVLP